jgi:Tfp pilus assembly protein PilX
MRRLQQQGGSLFLVLVIMAVVGLIGYCGLAKAKDNHQYS